MTLLDKLSDSLFSKAERTRNRAFLDAAMAASALVATADGEASFAQRIRIDEVLSSVEPLQSFDVHTAIDIFRTFADEIQNEPEEGRARALQAVWTLSGDAESVRLILRIACAVARAEGSCSSAGLAKVREIADAIGASMPELEEPTPVRTAAIPESPHHIAVGNQKGGTGKSTTAMHLAIGLLKRDYRVGCIDLDGQQGTLSHYLANRAEVANMRGPNFPMPLFQSISPVDGQDRKAAEVEESERLNEALATMRGCDFVILDTPGSESHLTRLGHARAETLITPLNDSFLDIDVLARVDRKRREVLGPSNYAKIVMSQNEERVAKGRAPIDWIVMRNRLAQLDARNTRDMARLLEQLSVRMGFRLQPGLSERVVYRELFFGGLTILDLPIGEDEARMNPSHWNARREVRELIAAAVARRTSAPQSHAAVA